MYINLKTQIVQQQNPLIGSMKSSLSLILIVFFLTSFNFADDDFTQKITKAFQEYNQRYSPCAIQVDFNQPSYFPGDTAFLSTKYFFLNKKESVLGRDVVNLAILDKTDSLISFERLVVQNGFGSHKLPIKSDITPGVYRLIAYTNWMLNLGKQSFFETELIVEGKGLMIRAEQNPEYYINNQSLIKGAENKIVIDVDTPTHGIPVELLDQNNNKLTSTLTDSLGLAELAFTPLGEGSYTILIDSRIKRSIKEPIKEGISIFTTKESNGTVITLQKSHDYNPSLSNYIIIYNHQKILQIKELNFLSDEVEKKFTIPNLDGLVFAEIVNSIGVSQGSVQFLGSINYPQIKVTLDKSEYSNRQPVNTKISLTNGNSIAEYGELNIRVINKKLYSKTLEISRPTLAKLQNSKFQSFQVDRWLVTQKKNIFINWEILLNGNKTQPYIRESYIQISGTAKNSITGKAVPDSTRVMLFFRNKAFGYEAYCKNGLFSIPILFDIEEVDKVFVSAKYKYSTLSDLAVSFDSNALPSIESYSKRSYKLSENPNPTFEYNSLKRKVDNSFGYYNATQLKQSETDEMSSILEDELGQPDYTLNMGDYLILPSMAEVTKELLKSVEYRKTKNSERIRVYVTDYDPRKGGDPLFIIDGHLTKNPKHFLQLDPSTLLTIKLYREKSKLIRFGTLSADGILIIKTSKPSKVPFDNEIWFDGLLSKANVPYFNLSKKPEVPDLRPCLYWNPKANADFSGEVNFNFTTADDVGPYLIQVSGYSDKGLPFFYEKQLTVVHSNNSN